MKNLGSKYIETERLELRAQTIKEQKRLWEILMIPEVNKYFLTTPIKFRDKLKRWDLQEDFYKKNMEHANDLDVYKWSIFLKGTNTCIGRLSCHERNNEDTSVTDPSIRGVGWIIDPQYQGQGYATEAATAMMNYMFQEVEINEIITGAAINNPASWKIMERFGFERQKNTDLIQYTFLDELTEVYRYVMNKNMYLKIKTERN